MADDWNRKPGNIWTILPYEDFGVVVDDKPKPVVKVQKHCSTCDRRWVAVATAPSICMVCKLSETKVNS